MKKVLSIFFVILYVFSVHPSWSSVLGSLKQGDIAPDFQVRTIDGKYFNLNDLKGKVTVIAFWQNGQEHSDLTMADIDKVNSQYRDKGVTVLAVNGDKSSDQDIKKYAVTHNITCHMAGDPDLEIYNAFGVFVLPTTVIIGPDSRLSFIHPLNSRDLHSQLVARIGYHLGEITRDQMENEINPAKAAVLGEARKKAERYASMGRMFMNNVKLKDQASQVLLTAMQTDPSYMEPHVLMAKLFLDENKLDKVVSELQEAFKLAPGSDIQDMKLKEAIAHVDSGRDFAAKNDIPSAVNAYKNAVEDLLTE